MQAAKWVARRPLKQTQRAAHIVSGLLGPLTAVWATAAANKRESSSSRPAWRSLLSAGLLWKALGTPARSRPPSASSSGGLYRHVRNPMYIAVGATIVGQALFLGQPVLLVYAELFFVVVASGGLSLQQLPKDEC